MPMASRNCTCSGSSSPSPGSGLMVIYWVPGVNNLGTHGRWAFAEFTEVYQMQDDFAKKVESEFNKMIGSVVNEN